jgi:integrase
VDVDGGIFYRHAEGKIENNKRQPAVKLAPRLLAHLRRWKAMDNCRGYVVTFNGTRIVTSPKTALSRAVELAELNDGVTPYSLRHTTATWLVGKGLSTRKVADYLGTSEEMVLRHYGHLAPDFQDEAALKIGHK